MNHKPSATQRSSGVANGAWFNARARMPVPMVAVNQFGVNWRTTPSKRRAAGGRVDVEAMAMVMENAPMDLALLSGRKAALAWRGEDARRRIILPIDDFDQFDLDLRLIASHIAVCRGLGEAAPS